MERIGFIGLGVMGKPMARNLLRGGIDLVVHSRSPGPAEELVVAGADRADTPSQVAAATDAVITMLPDTPTSSSCSSASVGCGRASGPGPSLST